MSPIHSLSVILVVLSVLLQSSSSNASLSAYDNIPSWYSGWNATLAKVNTVNDGIVWTKFYYDFDKGGNRFDFYNNYVDMDGVQSLNCSVLFTNHSIWFVHQEEKACTLRSASGIGVIDPWWVRNLGAQFVRNTTFRGVEAELYKMPDPDQPDFEMEYYAWSKDNRIPLRSQNQANDPGATDYFDVQVGPQRRELFDLPDYCVTNVIDKGCPWY